MEIDFSTIIASKLEVPVKWKNGVSFIKKQQSRKSGFNFLEVSESKPLIQMAAFPMSLEIEKYINPYSPSSPKGSYISAYSFRDLVNSVPKFSKYYTPGSNTIEKIYGNMLKGVKVPEEFSSISSTFADAKQLFEQSKLAAMDGIPSNWWLANANPNNWASKIQDKAKLPELIIDMNNLSGSFNNKFSIIDGSNPVELKIKDKDSKALNRQRLSNKSSLEVIRFKYIWVNITRDWLDTEVFNMSNWYIPGFNRGYYSNGKAAQNNGVLPLIPTSVLIGTDIEITASIGDSDLSVIKTAIEDKHEVSIDVFPVSAVDSSSNKSLLTYNDAFVMAYISELTPLAPKMQIG